MDSNEARAFLSQAQSLNHQGRSIEAIEYADKAIEAYSEYADAYLFKGQVQIGIEDYSGAEDTFDKLIHITPEAYLPYFYLGNAYCLQKDSEQALFNYNRSVALGNESKEIFFQLGLLYDEKNLVEMALRNYAKALLIDPMFEEAHIKKILVYIRIMNLNEALSDLREFVKRHPESFTGYSLSAMVLIQQNKTEEALELVSKGKRLFPHDPAFVIDEVLIYIAEDKYQEAKVLISEIFTNFSLDAGQKCFLMLQKAKVLSLEKDTEGVRDALLEARTFSSEEKEENPEVLYMLVNCDLELGLFDEAEEFAKKLIMLGDGTYDIAARFLLPYAVERKGDSAVAKELYIKGADELKEMAYDTVTNMSIYYFRALCLERSGSSEEAATVAKFLFKLNPDRREYRELYDRLSKS